MCNGLPGGIIRGIERFKCFLNFVGGIGRAFASAFADDPNNRVFRVFGIGDDLRVDIGKGTSKLLQSYDT